MDENICPICDSDLYTGKSGITLTNKEGDTTRIDVEVDWCEKCFKVIDVDY